MSKDELNQWHILGFLGSWTPSCDCFILCSAVFGNTAFEKTRYFGAGREAMIDPRLA